MDRWIDELARVAGSGLSRRSVSRRLGGGLLGVVALVMLPEQVSAANQTSDCNHYCNDFKHPDKQDCKDTCRACEGGAASMCGLVCCTGRHCNDAGICGGHHGGGEGKAAGHITAPRRR